MYILYLFEKISILSLMLSALMLSVNYIFLDTSFLKSSHIAQYYSFSYLHGILFGMIMLVIQASIYAY